MQDVSTGKLFVARNVIFNEREVPSFKTDVEVGFADFYDSSLATLRQNPIDMNNGNESIELGMGSPDVTVGHETDLEEVKDEHVETELEKVSIDSTSSGEVAITTNNQNSDTKLEPSVVPGKIKGGSDLQQAVSQRDFRCQTCNFEPANVK